MAKCFYTGVELPVQEMLVLDAATARRAVRDLRQRLEAVERLIQQLHPKDPVEVYDVRNRQSITIKQFRLVSRAVAAVLSETYPWERLFLEWNEFRAMRKATIDLTQAHKSILKKSESAGLSGSAKGVTP